MALIECHECKAAISDAAKACPQCEVEADADLGKPNQIRGTGMKAMLIAAALFPLAAMAERKTELDSYTLTYEGDGNQILEIVSPVRELPGTPAEITAKAQACATRSISNSGTSTPTVLEALGGGFKTASKESVPLIELVDKESGLLVANSVASYTSGMLSSNARSKVTVQAKDGRFRIVQSDLATARSDGKGGYSPVISVWGTGWEPALKSLIARTEKLSECMLKPVSAGEDW